MAWFFFFLLPYSVPFLAAMLVVRALGAPWGKGPELPSPTLDLGRNDAILRLGRLFFLACLFLAAVRHLRLFLWPIPGVVVAMQTPGTVAGFLAPLFLGAVAWRRFAGRPPLLPRDFADAFLLALAFPPLVTGPLLAFQSGIEIMKIKALLLDLIHLSLPLAWPDWRFTVHFLPVLAFLAALLLIGPRGALGYVEKWLGHPEH
ncbi:MAG: hypothetical protein V1816_25155 [Pseudomonadota bacterium]